eukprot:11219288-Lingulodinium_polyedra.AAC.1
MRLFRPNDRGWAARCNVRLCTATYGEEGKGRVARRMELAHFVDNDLSALWSCCCDRWGNVSRGLVEGRGALI